MKSKTSGRKVCQFLKNLSSVNLQLGEFIELPFRGKILPGKDLANETERKGVPLII